MIHRQLLTGGVLMLLLGPLGCERQGGPRMQTVAEEGTSMMAPKEPSGQEGAASRSRIPAEEAVVPVVQEELHIDRQQVETGRVRLTKRLHEREVLVEEPSVHEEVQIERVPVNRFVPEPVPVRYEGETMIISVMEEVPVVEMRLRLKEELRVTKRQITTPQSQPVRLRTEEVQIERLPPKSEVQAPSGPKDVIEQ